MQNLFDPDEIMLLAKVVEEACKRTGGLDLHTRKLMAVRVVGYASQGQRDFDALLAIALNGKESSHAD